MSKIEITQEKLEQALKACCTEEPADHYPCQDCYLYQFRDNTGHLSTGKSCFECLAYDTIDYIRRINDFEHSQCARLLSQNAALKSERDELKKALKLACEDKDDPLGFLEDEKIDRYIQQTKESTGPVK